jgi:hypothetical protein
MDVSSIQAAARYPLDRDRAIIVLGSGNPGIFSV